MHAEHSLVPSSARHLALCGGGRKSAYASLSDALTYSGPSNVTTAVTPAALALARSSLGIDPSLDMPEEMLDMSHFMNMLLEEYD